MYHHLKSETLHPHLPGVWLPAFVDHYLRDQPGTAWLTARPGEGRTTAAITLWERLWRDHAFQNLIVITPKALREQWLEKVKDVTPPKNVSTDQLRVYSIDQLRGGLPNELETVYRGGRTFVLIDEAHQFVKRSVLKDLFVPSPIQHVAASRTLYLTGVETEIQAALFGPLLSGRQYLYDPDIFRQSSVRKGLERLSPSQAILQQFWNRVLTLDSLSWREFEKLIAELLNADGYTIQLMKGTRDGGVDVVAIKEDGISGYYKTLWQAKKYTKNKVGIHFIRELADSVLEFNASKGIIVTTSFLTADALARVERDKYTLSKVDRTDLEKWIDRILYK